ncbi:MAG: family 16 glycoside hydrolase [Planctomycetaceae bacterium]
MTALRFHLLSGLTCGLLALSSAIADDPPLPIIPPAPAPTSPLPPAPANLLPPLSTHPQTPKSADVKPIDPWQGEYTGRVMVEGELQWYGMQLVTKGRGAAELVIFKGGLPGNLWDGKSRIAIPSTESSGRPLTFSWGDRQVAVSEDRELLVMQGGVQVGRLVQVIRKSRTLGAAPAKGAIVLFDGTSAETFDGGKMDEHNLLIPGTISKQSFGSFRLHLEFQTPLMPEARGQGRGNSGVYLQGMYEVQVLDSFGLDSQDNDCGGIYKIAPPSQNLCFPPLSWQTYDIDFQSAQFDNKGRKTKSAVVTVAHNGIVIHDQLPLPNATGGAKFQESPAGGPLYLQDHGNPVRFRNIWIVETEPAQKKVVASTPPPVPKTETPKTEPDKSEMKKPEVKKPEERKPATKVAREEPKRPEGAGWVPLFDGKTLAGWRTNREKIGHGTGGHWFVSQGAIVGEQDPPGSGNGGILLTEEKYENFELLLELRPDWGVDSGLFLRSTETGACFQVMVDYHEDGNIGQIYGEGIGGFTNRTFSLFASREKSKSKQPSKDPRQPVDLRAKSIEDAPKSGEQVTAENWIKAWKVGEWNALRVRVEGQPARVITWLNGVKVSEFDGENFESRSYDRGKVAHTLGKSGHLALQVHGGKEWPKGATVQWRNLWVRPLPATPEPPTVKEKSNDKQPETPPRKPKKRPASSKAKSST